MPLMLSNSADVAVFRFTPSTVVADVEGLGDEAALVFIDDEDLPVADDPPFVASAVGAIDAPDLPC